MVTAIIINYELVDFENEIIILLWVPIVFLPYFLTEKKVFFIIPFFIFLSINVVQLVHWLSIKCPLSAATLYIFFETNFDEAVGFADTYLSLFDWFYLISYVVLSALLAFKIQNFNHLRLSKMIYYFIIITFVVMISFRISKNKFHLVAPEIFVSTYDFFKEKQSIQLYNNNANNSFSVKKDTTNLSRIYVLVIGESLNRNHMSLYGYDRKTTPNLDKLIHNKELIKFNDIISAYTTTTASLQKALSFGNYENGAHYFSTIGLIQLMKKANFQTYWISNQSPIGMWDNYMSNIAKNCDSVYYMNLTGHSSKAVRKRSYDEKVLMPFAKILKNKTKDKFICIHLMGSHMPYRYRYPKNMNFFQDADKHEDADKAQYINQYDNSVLYNDYVVSNLIHTLNNSNVKAMKSILYFSDHGEEVYDSIEEMGHGLAKKTRHLVEVPFLLYLNDEYRTKYSEKTKLINESVNKPYMIDDLIHSICSIYGVYPEIYDSSRDLFSLNYNNKRQRLIEGKIDYDKEIVQ